MGHYPLFPWTPAFVPPCCGSLAVDVLCEIWVDGNIVYEVVTYYSGAFRIEKSQFGYKPFEVINWMAIPPTGQEL